VYADASHASKGLAPLALGGFLRLSGTPISSLYGQTSLLGRLVMGVPLLEGHFQQEHQESVVLVLVIVDRRKCSVLVWSGRSQNECPC
jgi:hypothetical protein